MICNIGRSPATSIYWLLCRRNNLLKSSKLCIDFIGKYSTLSDFPCIISKIGAGILKRKLIVHSTKLKHGQRQLGLSTQHNNWHSVTYVKDGGRITVKGKDGDSLLDVAINNNVDLEGFGACEGTLSCSTCHLIFKKEDFDKLPDPASDEELDMLDLAYGLTDTARGVKCISFAGSGFLSLYLAGAAKCLQERVPALLKTVSFCGASAGSLIAACLACRVPLDAIEQAVLSAAHDAQQRALGPFSPAFSIEEHLRQGLEHLPPDAHERARGKLFVSLTRARDRRNLVASEWASREELVQCLLCSCFIPLFSGARSLPTFRGETYVDGGFSDNLPFVARPALTISPFAGDAHICPKDRYRGTLRIRMGNHAMVPTFANLVRFIRALVPPPTSDLVMLREEGFLHTAAFLEGGAKTHKAA